MENLTAVILAGGLGMRLKSVVTDRPKVLAEVNGKPFLAYLLDQLISYDLKHVILCTGYRGQQVASAFGSRYKTLEIEYAQELEPLGTGGALKFALSLCRSRHILAMNGDSFCGADLRSFYTWYGGQNISTGAMLLAQVDNVERYGQVQCHEDGQIVAFSEKGQNSGNGWINAGVYLLDEALLQSIPEGRAVSLEKEIFPRWVDKGLYGYQCHGKFIDIGIPDTYFFAPTFFMGRH